MNPNHASPVLVDVRGDSVRAMSWIPTAITPSEFEEALAQFASHRVLTSCTVYRRSYLCTRKLAANGINAMN
ncbi:hypothetical protein [Rosistilla oblonga]|uniref:hypothetical protein n=1 Tax=Rosistilla oblonga TaxID=2527990 RepID=UPI003A96DDCA